jgi:hypothetical protein
MKGSGGMGAPIRRYQIAAAVFLAAMACGSAGAQPAGLIRKPYAQARVMLIKAGFAPVPLKHTPDRDQELGVHCPQEDYALHPEVLDCSGTGLSRRWFVFFSKARNQYLVVITTGEEKLTVTQWRQPDTFEPKQIAALR